MRFKKVYIEITNVCNLNCSFCSKTNRESRFMKVSEFEHIAREVKDFTSLIALHVKGEPLLHPELKEILEVCEKYNLKVNITTNGTLLLKNIDTILSSKAIRQINISLHSADQNMLNKQEYLKNIFISVDEIHKNTEIIISYRLWNLQNIKENEVNADVLKILGEKYTRSNILKEAQENEFLELDKNIFINQDVEFEWPSLDKEIISETGKCYGLRNQIAVLANGDIVPCCLDANGDILLGNIFEKTLTEVLESSRAKKIVKNFERHILVEDLCKRCDFIKKFSNM